MSPGVPGDGFIRGFFTRIQIFSKLREIVIEHLDGISRLVFTVRNQNSGLFIFGEFWQNSLILIFMNMKNIQIYFAKKSAISISDCSLSVCIISSLWNCLKSFFLRDLTQCACEGDGVIGWLFLPCCVVEVIDENHDGIDGFCFC